MNVAGEAVNKPSEKVIRTRSRFPSLSYHMYNTERFGEYNVNFVFDGVEGDRVPIRSGGRVQSYTLKAPLMQSISKKKDYYLVPMEAILPLNWQKWYTNPVVGDDVPDDCGTGVQNFWKKVCNRVEALRTACIANLKSSTLSDEQKLTSFIRFAVLAEMFFSNGNLIASLNCKGSRYLAIKDTTNGLTFSFDQVFDQLFLNSAYFVYGKYCSFIDSDGKVKYIGPSNYTDILKADYAVVSVHTMLQYFRDDLSCYIQGNSIQYVSGHNSLDWTGVLKILGDTATTGYYTWVFNTNGAEVNYDLRRLWAYQIVCAHYYSNDHVDYIYSADLFRQLVQYIVTYPFLNGTGSGPLTFTCNGVRLFYDYLSSKYFDYVLFTWLTDCSETLYTCLYGTTTAVSTWLGYFSNLFSYRRSLRYVDYFTGSRTRPLAIGDVNVDVQTGSPNYVNVVDVTRNIQRQRFFNAVNRFGRKFEEYIKGLSGITPAKDWHNPLYLAHTNDVVYGVETENTGAAQQTQAQSVTSRLTSNGARYQFEFECDRPCVVIGLTYYDISRSYRYACEKQLMQLNRFDMFNPFMQFIGDQEVNFAEIGTPRSIYYTGAFGYQLRHMEYKQRFDQCAGGFVENLPGYLFTNKADDARNGGNVDPDFIRSLNSELDEFYLALTGYSLGTYFHFIVDNDNYCDASRPMAYAPSIL